MWVMENLPTHYFAVHVYILHVCLSPLNAIASRFHTARSLCVNAECFFLEFSQHFFHMNSYELRDSSQDY